ncbi:hypothetical protein [uncultured Phycicoccus sp.]|uniref:hypothetical protein n=1 Tax=uncultured Phycicoccus sp. TaxID=661422 RepID=UPI002630710B|nr:hypothetical protein [uncultured Phycicoccus sp.]
MSTEPAPASRRPGAPAAAGHVAAALGTLAAVALLVRGSLGDGLYLFRDFVGVPSPAAPDGLLPTTSAALRAWPLDGVTWALSGVVPVGVQQAAILVGALLLAGLGTGLLVARWGPAPAVAASWLAVWNPYVAERLLLGQPPTLLGYACLPWVVLVVRSRRSGPARVAMLLVVAAPAALTPWGGLLVAVAAVLADLTRGDRSPRRAAVVAGVGLAWCLPWLVPALLADAPAADPDGAVAFALADDSGLGTWLSALMGGGVWATGARPPSRTDPVALASSVALLVLAAGGLLVLARRYPSRALVGAALLLAPATVATLASGPLVEAAAGLQRLPGVALVRDQHRLLAPAVLAAAVLVAVAVRWVGARGGRPAAAVGVGLVIFLTIAAVPDLPRLVRAGYHPVAYPGEWGDVVASVRTADGSPPIVLSLPWQPLRSATWAGPAPFLDPLPRALPDEVLTSSSLTVRRGESTVVVDDAPRSDGADWGAGRVSPESLRRAGVTHVVEWLDTPGAPVADRTGWRVVLRGEHFAVYDVATRR